MQIQGQQFYMSVLTKEKEINYNNSQFYRANPYANQGFLPPVSLKNRKQPQSHSQIPQGIEYFGPSNKKHFIDVATKSIITAENILSNPERYPFENTLANDINYLRNLSTIDIQGANANSKKSQGVRYRIKAQQQLLRRNAKIITPLLTSGESQEEKRRKIAIQQLQRVSSGQSSLKAGSRNYKSQTKLSPPDYFHRNPYTIKKQQGVQFDSNEQLEKQLLLHGRNQRQENKMELQNIDIIPKTNEMQNSMNDKIEIISNGSRSSNILSMIDYSNPQIRSIFDKQKQILEKDILKRQYRSQHRILNPTNLSYEGSIVRHSGILTGIGRNLANN